MDTTGSMGWGIDKGKETIKAIISKYLTTGEDIRFGLSLYRDHPT